MGAFLVGHFGVHVSKLFNIMSSKNSPSCLANCLLRIVWMIKSDTRKVAYKIGGLDLRETARSEWRLMISA